MIRPANPGDVGIIFKMIRDGREHLLIRAKDDILGNIKNFLVAEEDGKVIGCISLDVYSKKICEVRSLYVKPEYRNKGIGTELIKRILKKVKMGQEVFTVTSSLSIFKNLSFDFCLQEKFILYRKGKI